MIKLEQENRVLKQKLDSTKLEKISVEQVLAKLQKESGTPSQVGGTATGTNSSSTVAKTNSGDLNVLSAVGTSSNNVNSSILIRECVESIASLNKTIDSINQRCNEITVEYENAKHIHVLEQEFKLLKQRIKKMTEEKSSLEQELHMLNDQQQNVHDSAMKSTISSLEEIIESMNLNLQKMSLRLLHVNSEMEKLKKK